VKQFPGRRSAAAAILAAFHLAGAGLPAAATQQPGAPYGEASGLETPYTAAAADARRLVESYMADRGIPGVSVAVGVNGRIVWSEGFGYSNVESGTPMTTRTKFRGGSTAKPMTQFAASRLREEGRFDFDVPIQHYVPSYPRHSAEITPRILMGHLSGIRHYPPDGDEFHSRVHFENILDALDIFANDPLLFEPGTGQSYTTYGTTLLGAAVQEAAGERFLAVLHRYVFEPLGMRSTVGEHLDSIIPDRSAYYERTNSRPHYHLRKSSWGDGSTLGVLLNAPYVDNSNKTPAGGILTTPEDLVRFGSAHLAPGYLQAETLDLTFTPVRLRSGEVTDRGLNWALGTTPEGGRIANHSGGGVGGNSAMIVYLDDGVVVAAQANMSQSDPDIVARPIGEIFRAAARAAAAKTSQR